MSNYNKLQTIIREQNDTFIDRRDEIWAGWAALLCSEHVFLLGSPGVAKSMLITDIVRRMTGAKLFDYLMFKDTSRSEIIGPPNMLALQKGSYEFILKDGIAEAHIAFLDEAFKASSSILNTALGIMNERELKNGTSGTVKVPLISMFIASNELPESQELNAMYDRILFRLSVRDIEASSDFLQLIKSEPKLNGQPTTLSLDELYAAQKEVAAIQIPDDLKEKIVELRDHLRMTMGIHIFPRRWLKGLKAVRANAYLSGRREADMEDLEIFQHILWETPAQMAKVKQAVFGIANPARQEILSLLDQAESAMAEVRKLQQGGEKTDLTVGGKVMEYQQKMKKISDELKQMIDRRVMSEATRMEAKEVRKKVQGYNRKTLELTGVELD